MAQIPTAEKTLKKWQNSYKTSKPVIYDSLIEEMKEFAKLHVKAALEAAHKNMQLPTEDLEFTLSAYPETNIK